jgi:hypothetical protein
LVIVFTPVIENKFVGNNSVGRIAPMKLIVKGRKQKMLASGKVAGKNEKKARNCILLLLLEVFRSGFQSADGCCLLSCQSVTVGQRLSIFAGQGVALPGILVAAKATAPFFLNHFVIIRSWHGYCLPSPISALTP